MRSILRGYFVGSLLLLRSDRDRPPFSPTLLRGAKSIYTEVKPELLLLDGQQRLTSLIYALTAPDLPLKGTKLRRWFFIDLDLLSRDPDHDDIVIERSKRDIDDLHTPAAQYQRHLIPCTVLLRPADFYKWRDGFEDWVRANLPEKEAIFRSEWRQAWQKIVDRVQNFEVPLVELPRVAEDDADAMGRVCAIFEKLNSTGVDLSVYDLLTARLYRSKIAVHQLWDEACDKNPLLAEWSSGKADTNKFGVLVLRTLALLRDLDPKPKMLIALDPLGFEADWRRAARAMNRALEIVTALHDDGMGVFHRDWLRNFGLLPVPAALRAVVEEKNLGTHSGGHAANIWVSVQWHQESADLYFLPKYSQHDPPDGFRAKEHAMIRADILKLHVEWELGRTEPQTKPLSEQYDDPLISRKIKGASVTKAAEKLAVGEKCSPLGSKWGRNTGSATVFQASLN